MNNRILVFCLLFLFSLFSKTYADDKIVVSEDVYLIHLDDSIFVHVSWVDSEDFGRYPSNGMLIVNNGRGGLLSHTIVLIEN
ncbi:MAG: hypothetical protein K9G70_01080 [Prolixibacteraceae bacterium]|nr:hypothetical protein [Prolixibacteraceae bacterium]